MILSNKIDFLCIVVADHCNPNGDPLCLNRPRQSFDGFGEITPESIKRKIRNRLQDMGERVFVQSDDRSDDGFRSLKERAEGSSRLKEALAKKKPNRDVCAQIACEEWIDARSFGQVFAYKGESKGEGVSISIRGPVSVTYAKTIAPIEILEIGGTKSVNTLPTENGKKDSGTFFVKHVINHGVYVFSGGIFPQLAQKTGFSDEDAEKIKQALLTLFENDASSSRPSGSMSVGHLFWWRHSGKQSVCQPQKLFESIKINPTDVYPFYSVDVDNIYDADIYNML